MTDLTQLTDGIWAIFIGDLESSVFQSAQTNYETSKTEFRDQQAGLAFVEQLDAEISGLEEAKFNLKNNNIIWVEKAGAELTYLIHKENPQADADWVEVAKDFLKNYAQTEAESDNLWKWGQVVPEDGDYLCVDCGYIETLKKGQIFPVCEVCLSGEPGGIRDQKEGYWELV